MFQIQKSQTTHSSLRLGYSFFGSIEDLDPNNIQTIYQSNLIENIFSRLIEYDNAGQIICSLCSSFQVDGSNIEFSFRNVSKTIDGYHVAAAASAASLNRIRMSQTNTHGSLDYFLDRQSANPIEVKNDKLLVRVAKEQWVPFVLNLLTSMDFSIIPLESIDSSGERIIDYRNTSGLFYFDRSEDQKALKLKVNSRHINYKEGIPQQIQLVPISSGEASEAFLANKIDMIDPTYYGYEQDVEKILKNLPDAQLHKTLNIGLTSLVFSARAMRVSSIDDRLSAALTIKEVFKKKTPAIFGSEETDQFFQSFGQGFISPEQHKALKSRLDKSLNKSGYRFVLGVTERYRNWFSDSDFPDYIVLKFFKQFPGFLPESERPDVYIMTGDSSFDEDISALSYLFSQGIFSLGRDDGAEWIQDYMNISSKKDRIEALRRLHYEMLHTVKVFPVISRPYIAICNSNWSFDFPRIYAGSPLWRVWSR